MNKMVRQIWTRIVLLLALAILPITILFLRVQQESVRLVFDLADNTRMRENIDEYLQFLRNEARNHPEREGELRTIFSQVSGVKRAAEEFFLARDSLESDFRFQSLAFAAGVLAISLVLSLVVSRGIVSRFRQLLRDRERAQIKLQDHAALRQWQLVARSLVHELRAPITPIKLIATDLDRKLQTLNPEAFARYVAKAQVMLNEQVEAIEAMINGFTQFGKLPPPDPKPGNWANFLRDFVQSYQGAFGAKVTLLLAPIKDEHLELALDQSLLRNLLFNLCRNASEANAANTEITLSSGIDQDEGVVRMRIHNTGKSIPPENAAKIFEPYVSANVGVESVNMGLGLTVARKIAMDHGGDLRLEVTMPEFAKAEVTGSGKKKAAAAQIPEAEGDHGVTFVLELPLNYDAKSEELLREAPSL